jgi:hypothetical protein
VKYRVDRSEVSAQPVQNINDIGRRLANDKGVAELRKMECTHAQPESLRKVQDNVSRKRVACDRLAAAIQSATKWIRHRIKVCIAVDRQSAS